MLFKTKIFFVKKTAFLTVFLELQKEKKFILFLISKMSPELYFSSCYVTLKLKISKNGNSVQAEYRLEVFGCLQIRNFFYQFMNFTIILINLQGWLNWER